MRISCQRHAVYVRNKTATWRKRDTNLSVFVCMWSNGGLTNRLLAGPKGLLCFSLINGCAMLFVIFGVSRCRLRNVRYCFNTVLLVAAWRLLVTRSSLARTSWLILLALVSKFLRFFELSSSWCQWNSGQSTKKTLLKLCHIGSRMCALFWSVWSQFCSFLWQLHVVSIVLPSECVLGFLEGITCTPHSANNPRRQTYKCAECCDRLHAKTLVSLEKTPVSSILPVHVCTFAWTWDLTEPSANNKRSLFTIYWTFYWVWEQETRIVFHFRRRGQLSGEINFAKRPFSLVGKTRRPRMGHACVSLSARLAKRRNALFGNDCDVWCHMWCLIWQFDKPVHNGKPNSECL